MVDSHERNPLQSYAPTVFEQHSATSPVGITLRKGDGRTRLQEMHQAEEGTRLQEQRNTEVTDRIARMNAEHTLNMQYLIQFGVRADERHLFRRILSQVSEHGGLSLREAASLAHAKAQRNGLGRTEDLVGVLSLLAESSFPESTIGGD